MLFSGRGGATGCSEGRSGERCDSWGGAAGLGGDDMSDTS